jgi:hypothetical protein
MSSFTDATAPISYNHLASRVLGKDVWNVASQFTYYTDVLHERHWVEIPLGFLTDGASVPRLFWNLLPPWGQYGNAAIVHDYLCENLKLTDASGETVDIDRTTADQILNEAMKVLETSTIKRILIYGAVRCYFYLSKVKKRRVNPRLVELKRTMEQEYASAHKS